MENSPAPGDRPEPALGPRPARATRRHPPSLAQAAVLEVLERRPDPVTLAGLMAATGLHENTLREHLEALMAQGRVRRQRSRPAGRGRPAWRYEATDEDVLDGAAAQYAELAATLAAVIHRTSASPRQDAIAAGTQWGRELAVAGPPGSGAGGPPGPVSDRTARELVVGLLAELGFDPRPDEAATAVDLTRCPLLHAARRYPDVVCGVHLGIVQGVLQELGADRLGAKLVPFSAPGACRLELATRPAEAGP